MARLVSRLEVSEELASELVKKDWVNSVSTMVEKWYNKENPVVTSHLRMCVHTNGKIHTKDQYLNKCCEIMSDPFWEMFDKSIKFDKQFYDTCIYLHYVDKRSNILDLILSIPYGFKKADKEALYSDISGCNMKLKNERISCGSWACEVEAEG